MALGARAGDVVRMVLSPTSWTVGVGLAAGVVLCVALDTLASQWLTESSRGPVIIAGVTALLLGVSAIACVAPARGAASIDPMEASDTTERAMRAGGRQPAGACYHGPAR